MVVFLNGFMKIRLAAASTMLTLGAVLALSAVDSALAARVKADPDQAFMAARDAFRAGDEKKLANAAAAAQGHVLAPWVRYYQLRLRLEDRPADDIETFLRRYDGSLPAEQLRRDWLKVLGRQGDWKRFNEQAPLLVGDDADVACYSLLARWLVVGQAADGGEQRGDQRGGERDRSALNEAGTYWMSARDVPDGCAPLVREQFQSGQWGLVQVWARFRVLIEAGQPAAARRALDYLPFAETPEAKMLTASLDSPIHFLERPKPQLATRTQRELYLMAVVRVSKSDPQLAASYWDADVRARYPAADNAWVLARIATSAARKLMPEALGWYQEADAATSAQAAAPASAQAAAFGGGAAGAGAGGIVPAAAPAAPQSAGTAFGDEQLAWRVRIALRQGNWEEVRGAIERMSPAARNDPAWIYWLGRYYKAQAGPAGLQPVVALNAPGAQVTARALFARIAGDYSYYGRLAADELGLPMQLPPESPGPTPNEMAALALNPGLQRALAFYRLDMRVDGTREWNWSLRGMDDRTLLATAELARRNELWDRAIGTADRTIASHDFKLRYLAPYRSILADAAKSSALDEPLVLGLVRQESRFISVAKSGVGASGLMQLMPATAKWVAHKLGLKDYSWGKVHEPEVNAKLGTAYLKQVLDSLDGYPALAAAAYNAGPGRAQKWRDARPLEGAVYVESIPFNETRDYVKKVMANTVFYSAVLGGANVPLKTRLGTIAGRGAGDSVAVLKDSEGEPIP